MKFVVAYELAYTHRVMVGVESSSETEALETCERAFDEGTIWDDSRHMPLLFDDFEEDDGACLEWKALPVEAFPEPDASVRELQRRESAFAACTALVEIIDSANPRIGLIGLSVLDEAYTLAKKAMQTAAE